MANFWGAAQKGLDPGAQMGMQFLRWALDEKRHQEQREEKKRESQEKTKLTLLGIFGKLAGKPGTKPIVDAMKSMYPGIEFPELPEVKEPTVPIPAMKPKEKVTTHPITGAEVTETELTETGTKMIPGVMEVEAKRFEGVPAAIQERVLRGIAKKRGFGLPEEPEEYKRGPMAREAYDLALAELGNKNHPQFNKVYQGYLMRIFRAKQAQREKSLVQIQLGKPAPSQERESLNKLFEFKTKLTRISKLFDPSFVGRFEGGISGATREFFGVSITQKEVMFRQIVKDIADTLLRLRSGAQINEQEYARLSKLVPTVGLPDEVFLARLQSLAQSIDESVSIRQRTLKESGFMAPGATTINIQQMSDEELIRSLGE